MQLSVQQMTTGPWASVLIVQRMQTQIEILKLKISKLKHQREYDKYMLNKMLAHIGTIRAALVANANRSPISEET